MVARSVVVGQRLYGIALLGLDVKRLTARDQHLRVGRGGEQRRDSRRCLDDLLEVVQEDKQPLAPHVLAQAVVGSDRRSDRMLDQSGIAERLQRNPEDAIGKLLDRLCRELKCQARLSAAAGPSQRQQAMRANELPGFLELALPAHERSRLYRQVGAIEGPQRRELVVPELVQTLRRAQVLEAVLPQVTELRAGVEQARRRLGQKDLAAVAGAHDPRRPMYVDADVSLLSHDGLAGVEAD